MSDVLQTLACNVLGDTQPDQDVFPLTEHLSIEHMTWRAGWAPMVIAASSSMPGTDARFTDVSHRSLVTDHVSHVAQLSFARAGKAAAMHAAGMRFMHLRSVFVVERLGSVDGTSQQSEHDTGAGMAEQRQAYAAYLQELGL